MMSTWNWVDIVILVIFLASILAGLVRGLVREVIALLTWIAAIVISVMFSTKLAAVFSGSEKIQSLVSSTTTSTGVSTGEPVSIVAIGLSFILLFIATLIVGAIINFIFSRAAEVGGISFMNRLLGAVFGLARGFLVVVVAIFLLQLTAITEQSYWSESQFVASFQPAVKWLSDLVSPELENLKARVGGIKPQ